MPFASDASTPEPRVVVSEQGTINESGTHDDKSLVAALDLIKKWAESSPGIHHTEIEGFTPPAQIDAEVLSGNGYTFHHPKEGSRSNFRFWDKSYSYYSMKIQHTLHTNGTWTLKITPEVVQTDPYRMFELARKVLFNGCCGENMTQVVLRQVESSRPVTQGPVKEWMDDSNCTMMKVYQHGKYEVRTEITYNSASMSPKISVPSFFGFVQGKMLEGLY